MRSLIFRYALKNVIYNKKKSFLTAFLYFISTVFFIVEALSLYNYQISSSRRLDNTFGVHDGIFLCSASEYTDTIKNNSCVAEAGTIAVRAEAFRNENFQDREIILGYPDESAVSLCRIDLIEGELPKNENEIALEQSLLNFIYPDANVGEEIEMQLFMPQSESRTFRLTGIMNNISDLQWDASEGTLPMINAVVSADFFPDSDIYSFVSIDYTGDARQLDTFVNSMLQTEGISAFTGNQRSFYDALELIGGSDNKAGMIVIITILLVFTLSILLAASYIYKRGSGETVGLLKTAGFSVSSVMAFFVIKFLILLIPSVLIGSFAGLAFSMLVSESVIGTNELEGVFEVLSVCAAVIISFSLLFNVLNAAAECKKPTIENLRPTSDVKRQKPSSYTSTDPVLLYSVKNFILNGKEIAASCIMVFLAVLVMFTSLAVTSQMRSNLDMMARPYDLYMAFPDTEITALSVKLNNELGISDNEYNTLKASPDAGDILGLKCFDVYELTAEETDYSYMTPSTYDLFMKHKKIIGFPSEYNLIYNRLYGVDDDVLERLKKYLIAGEIDVDALRTGEEIILTVADGEQKFKVGDTISLAQGVNSDPDDPSFDSISLWQHEVKIAALISYSGENSDDPLLKECLHGMIWHEDAFERVELDMHYREIYVSVADKEQYDSLSGLINDLRLYYSNGSFSMLINDFLQESKAYESSYSSFRTITVIISVGLFIFSLVCLAAAVTAKITKRRRIFGFLRAVGLTRYRLFSIIFLENFISLFIAYVLGTLCSIGLSFLFLSGSSAGINYPFAQSILLFLIYFVITALICLLAAVSNYRHTIIDLIRYAE